MKSVANIDPAEFEALLLRDRPFLDVRAPVEFNLGALPGAVNLPLLTNEERHQIGLTYRISGQAAAVALGHQLVSGEVREARLQGWLAQVKKNPNTVLYCFRGGLRSQIVQKWLSERGVEVPLVTGGYKALRRFALGIIEDAEKKTPLLVVGGPTGAGKTRYLRSSGKPFVDLEALAKHRGSAFGAEETPQPTQTNFENALAVALLRAGKSGQPVLVENESQMIGRCTIPHPFFLRLQSSPRLILDVPFEERVETIFQDYVVNSKLGTRGDVGRFTELEGSVTAISKKLGGERTKEILADLATSRIEFVSEGSLAGNRVWIRKLLAWYYDPLYQKSPKL